MLTGHDGFLSSGSCDTLVTVHCGTHTPGKLNATLPKGSVQHVQV